MKKSTVRKRRKKTIWDFAVLTGWNHAGHPPVYLGGGRVLGR